jgi:uncharacterized protein
MVTFRQSQRDWIKNREACRTAVDWFTCLKEYYERRFEQFDARQNAQERRGGQPDGQGSTSPGRRSDEPGCAVQSPGGSFTRSIPRRQRGPCDSTTGSGHEQDGNQQDSAPKNRDDVIRAWLNKGK